MENTAIILALFKNFTTSVPMMRVFALFWILLAAAAGVKFNHQNLENNDMNRILSTSPDANNLTMIGNATVTGTLSTCVKLSESVTCPNSLVPFYLYTSLNRERALIDTTNANWFANNNFNITKKTVLLIHGYGTGDQSGGTPILRTAYLRTGEYNVINADFAILMKTPCFTESVYNLMAMSKCTAHMLAFLERSTGVKSVDVTCVGHSLGAHVCGITANYLPTKLNRIIALDPAKPLIRRRSSGQRLDASDAVQVEVIHTNAGFLGLPGFVGTVDFCADGGFIQSTCRSSRNRNTCSHSQSICIMAESLFQSKRRTAVPCEKRCPYRRLSVLPGSNEIVGNSTSSSASGMYCFNLSTAPYCNLTDPNYGDAHCCG
ncbi:phospholipase A1-like isoform X2 [Neocloeon triangulifer]|uniref:phospholipase A1-like isoform X2 n=1 Tax=Neocloeon triangulifer TaxID=2078957 RepID=UPI00286F2220|nr:phospholipase A1-like isoform X2 [Neocloeon triangulifer]